MRIRHKKYVSYCKNQYTIYFAQNLYTKIIDFDNLKKSINVSLFLQFFDFSHPQYN